MTYFRNGVVMVCTILLISVNTFAYNTADQEFDDKKGGHEEITDWNVKLAVKEGVSVLFHSPELKLGAHDEDFGNNSLHHFYNPQTGQGLFGILPTAKTTAESWYEKAVKDRSFYALGHALHLLQDMAAPSHAKAASHRYAFKRKIGYEWWVTKNWTPRIQILLENTEKTDQTFNLIRAGNIDGYIEGMANATCAGGYNYDDDFIHELSMETTGKVHANIVGDQDAAYNANFLIPSIARLGAGLLKTFCIDINCGGKPVPFAINNTSGNDHGDDTFDVASRLIELEQIDPTKELWKDIYGRTGIKKGYIGLFVENELSKAYQQFSTANTDAEFNQYAVVFQSVLNGAQAASKHSFEETYLASPDVAVLSNGFVDESADLLVKRIQEPVREIRDSFNAKALASQPVLFIPSGGLMGLTDSAFFKYASGTPINI